MRRLSLLFLTSIGISFVFSGSKGALTLAIDEHKRAIELYLPHQFQSRFEVVVGFQDTQQ